jgi:hypothetical protein
MALTFDQLLTIKNLVPLNFESVVHLDPAGSEIICKLGSGSVIDSGFGSGFESGSKLSSVSN